MSRLRARSLLLLGMALVQTACGAGWHRLPDLSPSALPVRQQVEVWRAGRALRLHAVRIEPDTIRGVPFVHPPDCAQCAVVLARADVDSLRVGRPLRGFWRSAGLALGVLFVVAILSCARFGGCEPAAAT